MKDLGRLLEGAAEPVYVVDAGGRIVYVNAACAQWLDCAPEDLVGRIGQYATLANRLGKPADAACALCPPPAALAGSAVRTTLLHPGGKLLRQATFLPLRAGADELQGVLAVLSIADEAAPADDAQALAPAETAGTPAASPRDIATPLAAAESTLLHQQLRKYHLLQAQRYGMERLAGRSPAMARARAQVALAATSAVTVQIVSPAGTLGEQLARTIHAQSGMDPAARFVPLPCAVLPVEQLLSIASALLGGAPRTPPADGAPRATATLFFQDVDALPRDAQAALVQVLASCPPSVRVVSSSRRPLEDLAREGRFAAGLAAWLSTLCIQVPPLAQRAEDIPLLAQQILEERNRATGKQVAGFTSEALDALCGYSWPRDVDELEEMVRAAHAQAEGAEATAADLPYRVSVAADAAIYRRPEETQIELEAYLKKIELELLNRAMKRAKGNKAKAARLLGMTRPRLYRRLVQLGLVKRPPSARREPPRPKPPPEETVDFQEL